MTAAVCTFVTGRRQTSHTPVPDIENHLEAQSVWSRPMSPRQAQSSCTLARSAATSSWHTRHDGDCGSGGTNSGFSTGEGKAGGRPFPPTFPHQD